MNEIIKVCIKSLTDTVRNQGIALRELEQKIRNKPSLDEINNSINIKTNNGNIYQAIDNLSQELLNRPTHEEISRILSQKPSIGDVTSLINDKMNNNNNMKFENNYNNLSYKFDLFKNEILNKMNDIDNNCVKRNELINIKNEIDNKANIADVENALDTKEDKDKIFSLLKSKIDINEIQNLFENKVDQKDLFDLNKKLDEKLNKNDFDQFLENYKNNPIEDNIRNKVDMKEFKLLSDSYNDFVQKTTKKVDDIDTDLDRLIESVKEQFKSLNVVISNLDQNKIDNNDFDIEKLKNLDSILGNKVNKDELNNIVNKTKNNCLDAINNFKNGENANMKMFEDKINNKIDKIIYDNQSMMNDLANTNKNINNYFTQKEAEMESLMTRMRLLISDNELNNNNRINNMNNNNMNNTQEERLKSEINNMIENNNNRIIQKLNEKLEVLKFEEFLNDLKEDLDNKIDLVTLKNYNQDIINQFNNKIRELFTDINSELANKISKNELEPILSNRLDANYNNMLNNNNLLNNNFNNLLDDKLSVNDFKEYMDNISSELKQKLDINKFNSIISTFNSNFENIHKDMNSKADLKNMIELTKNKLDTDNFNKIIKSIQKDISSKVNSNDFSNAMDNQAIINDTLCNENNLGRWLWKSGKVKNNLGVPWEIQVINTSPDNFKWEKDKSVIIVNEGGLYEINLGFYADKKPMVQIMVNGEVVISAINSNSFVIHQSTGGRMKGTGKTSFGTVTGLTMVDFIILPDKAKISISYTGEEGIGFLGLKKL